jgi:hypothetical protein
MLGISVVARSTTDSSPMEAVRHCLVTRGRLLVTKAKSASVTATSAMDSWSALMGLMNILFILHVHVIMIWWSVRSGICLVNAFHELRGVSSHILTAVSTLRAGSVLTAQISFAAVISSVWTRYSYVTALTIVKMRRMS